MLQGDRHLCYAFYRSFQTKIIATIYSSCDRRRRYASRSDIGLGDFP